MRWTTVLRKPQREISSSLAQRVHFITLCVTWIQREHAAMLAWVARWKMLLIFRWGWYFQEASTMFIYFEIVFWWNGYLCSSWWDHVPINKFFFSEAAFCQRLLRMLRVLESSPVLAIRNLATSWRQRRCRERAIWCGLSPLAGKLRGGVPRGDRAAHLLGLLGGGKISAKFRSFSAASAPIFASK